MANEPTSPAMRSALLKLALLGVAGLLLLAVAKALNVQEYLRQALDWISRLGPTGIALYVGIYIAASVLFVPCLFLTLSAGVIWGVTHGVWIVSLASTLGATSAFLVSRYAVRGWVTRKLGSDPRFRAIDDAVAREGWKIVGLTRLAPVFPYFLLNYFFGITRVPLRHYVLATWLGMLPTTLMFVYVGSLAGSLANLSGARQRTPAEWAFYVFGLVVTIVTTVLITQIARRALAASTSAPKPAGSPGVAAGSP